MKTYMPLNGLRWSRDSGSAHCDMPQSAVLGRPGGKEHPQMDLQQVIQIFMIDYLYVTCCILKVASIAVSVSRFILVPKKIAP